MSTRKTPSASDRVRASEARKIEAGGMRMPGGVLSPEATAAARALVEFGLYTTVSAAIAGSLIAELGRARRRMARKN